MRNTSLKRRSLPSLRCARGRALCSRAGASLRMTAGLSLALALRPLHAQDDLARWQRQAQNVTIIRDTWGIAHVYGHTDADAVFGAIYAQAEDDFNRVERNYITAMGRSAEFMGESAIWEDLRMKLYIRPDSLKAWYAHSPGFL